MSEKSFLRSNLSPEQVQVAEANWFRLALAVTQGVTRSIDHENSDAEEVADVICSYANELLYNWDDQFHDKPWINEPEPTPEEMMADDDGEPARHNRRGRRG